MRGTDVMDLTPASAKFLAASIPTPLHPASSRFDAVEGKGCVSLKIRSMSTDTQAGLQVPRHSPAPSLASALYLSPCLPPSFFRNLLPASSRFDAVEGYTSL